MTDLQKLRRKLRLSRRRGKYAVASLGKKITKYGNGWKCRMIPSSGSGGLSDINVFPDLEAINTKKGIYIAFEVKSSSKDKIYVNRPLQIMKLFESMNVMEIFSRRWAVLACKFKKQWRFMILRTWHTKLLYIRVLKNQKKDIFPNLKSLLQYIEEDKTVYFPLETPQKTEA